jgi:hypothetical protein
MNIAVLLLTVQDQARQTQFTHDWTHRAMREVAKYYLDQSGGRENLEWRVFDWFQLPITGATWNAFGFGAGDKVVPMVEAALRVDLSPYATVGLVIDKLDAFSAAGAPGTRYIHFGAQSLTPAIIAHELGHVYGTGHANLDSPAGSIEYGDNFSVMGGEGSKYSFFEPQLYFKNVSNQELTAFSPSGPGMVAPNLVSCGWLDPSSSLIESMTDRLTAQGEVTFRLWALRGAPPAGTTGRLVAAYAQTQSGATFTVEYRSRDGWDRAMPNPGKGARGWIVAHVDAQSGSGAPSLQVGSIPAAPGMSLYAPKAGFRITVTGADLEHDTVLLRVGRDGVVAGWKGAGDDGRLFFNSSGDGQNFTEQQVIPGTGGTSHGPALAAWNDRLYVAWKGAGDDGRLFFNSSADGQNFTEQQVIPGTGGTSHGPALALFLDPRP